MDDWRDFSLIKTPIWMFSFYTSENSVLMFSLSAFFLFLAVIFFKILGTSTFSLLWSSDLSERPELILNGLFSLMHESTWLVVRLEKVEIELSLYKHDLVILFCYKFSLLMSSKGSLFFTIEGEIILFGASSFKFKFKVFLMLLMLLIFSWSLSISSLIFFPFTINSFELLLSEKFE